MQKQWSKPKVIYRGMCPTMKEYPNELTICYNKSYFEERYKPYGWKVAPNKMLKSLKNKKIA